MRRWASRLGLIVAGTLVGLLLAELILRLFLPQPIGDLAFAPHADLLSAPVSGASGTVTIPGIYRYTFSHDAQGRRDTGSSGLGKSVYLFGDSFAYGMGVEGEETAAAVLEAALRSRAIDAHVVNAAAPGKDVPYTPRLLQTRGTEWKPDLPVYLFYPNDYVGFYYQSYFEVAGRTLVPRKPSDPWQERRVAVASNPVFRFFRGRSHLFALARR